MVEVGETYPSDPPCSEGELREALEEMKKVFGSRLERRNQDLEKSNQARVESRLASLRASYEIKIRRWKERLRIAQIRGSEARYIRMAEGSIKKLESDLAAKIAKIESERRLDVSFYPVAAGYLKVRAE